MVQPDYVKGYLFTRSADLYCFIYLFRLYFTSVKVYNRHGNNDSVYNFHMVLKLKLAKALARSAYTEDPFGLQKQTLPI